VSPKYLQKLIPWHAYVYGQTRHAATSFHVSCMDGWCLNFFHLLDPKWCMASQPLTHHLLSYVSSTSLHPDYYTSRPLTNHMHASHALLSQTNHLQNSGLGITSSSRQWHLATCNSACAWMRTRGGLYHERTRCDPDKSGRSFFITNKSRSTFTRCNMS
jgi:hypothetical protein